jgi:AraC-like DNA-binding protein
MVSKSSSSIEKISRTLRRTDGAGVTFGEVVYQPGGSYGPRLQGDWQLVAVLEGEASVQVGAREFVIHKGEVALLHPGHQEFFRFSAGRRTHHSWCAVSPQLPPAALALAEMPALAAQALTPRLAALFEMALAISEREAQDAPLMVQALGLAALAEHARATRRVAAPLRRGDEVPAALQHALDWIGQRYAEPMDAPGLAKLAGVSPAQLTKLFRRHLGTTPMRAVWEARTRAGVRLLRDSGLSVGEIAHRCGFQTTFHFSRWVRAMESLSPGQVRAQAWAGLPPTGG